MPPLPAPTLWPADVLAQRLRAPEPEVRLGALGMAVQSGAPLAACREALLHAAQACTGDALAAQLAVSALGSLPPAQAQPEALDWLATQCAPTAPPAVRTAAAHALYRLQALPDAAVPSVQALLLDAEPNARRVALLAFSPFATRHAASLAPFVLQTPPGQWTTELLQALAASAGDDPSARERQGGFLVRILQNAPLLPTALAGYAALARLNPRGPALQALLDAATRAPEAAQRQAALEAVGALGEAAQSAAPVLARLLVACSGDAAQEESLCRALVRVRARPGDMPLPHIAQRVARGPDRAAAAHCMLLCLHPRACAGAAPTVRERFARSGEALRPALSQTHKMLAGTELTASETVPEV